MPAKSPRARREQIIRGSQSDERCCEQAPLTICVQVLIIYPAGGYDDQK